MTKIPQQIADCCAALDQLIADLDKSDKRLQNLKADAAQLATKLKTLLGLL